jgi:hypothetical protein
MGRERLRSVVEKFFGDNIDHDNVLSLLHLADHYQAYHLKVFCTSYVFKHQYAITSCGAFSPHTTHHTPHTTHHTPHTTHHTPHKNTTHHTKTQHTLTSGGQQLSGASGARNIRSCTASSSGFCSKIYPTKIVRQTVATCTRVEMVVVSAAWLASAWSWPTPTSVAARLSMEVMRDLMAKKAPRPWSCSSCARASWHIPSLLAEQ